MTLPITGQDLATGEVNLRMPGGGGKKNIYTPGYYMIFYVSGSGKPSVASIVRFDGD